MSSWGWMPALPAWNYCMLGKGGILKALTLMRQPRTCAHPYMCIYLYLRWADTSLMWVVPSLRIDLIAKLFTSWFAPIHKLANTDALIVASNDMNIILAMVPLTCKLTIQCERSMCHSWGNFPLHFECSLNLFTLTTYSQVISITCECNHSIHFWEHFTSGMRFMHSS